MTVTFFKENCIYCGKQFGLDELRQHAQKCRCEQYVVIIISLHYD